MSTYLTVKDVAEMLQITEKKAKAIFKVEGFPCVKIGVTYYVRADKFDTWAESHEGGESVKLDYSVV